MLQSPTLQQYKVLHNYYSQANIITVIKDIMKLSGLMNTKRTETGTTLLGILPNRDVRM